MRHRLRCRPGTALASGRTPGDIAPLQLPPDDNFIFCVDAVDLEYRLGDIETDCRDRMHAWLLQIVGALTAPTFMALTCRWRSRPQHHWRTLRLWFQMTE